MGLIVIGYDGSDEAKRALERTRTLAEAFGAQVVIVFVLHPPPAADVGAALTISDESREMAEEELREAQLLLADSGIESEAQTVVGEPGHAIVEIAEELGADLIVTGTRERGFLERLVTGSVSETVTRQAPCDVLIVH